MFVAGLAFLQVISGGLVTSNNAGLAVPNWPTNFGSIHQIPLTAGGVRSEHDLRVTAGLVGLLTIVTVIWTWLVDKRRWMQGLTLAAVTAVVFQGVLAWLTVSSLPPSAISIAHAVVEQTIFCVLAAIALFTGRSWLQEPTQRVLRREARPLLRDCWILIGLLYLQLILGTAFRHVRTKWGLTAGNRWPASKIIHLFLFPHIANALPVSALVLFISLRVISKHFAIPHLRRPALALLVLLVFQLLLGVSAYFTRVVQSAEELPTASLTATTLAHIGLGAVILAVTAVLTTQAYRYRREPAQVLPFERHREVVSA